MRLFIIIFFLSLSAKVLAQSVDTSKRFMIVDAVPVDSHAKPLYIVDGVIFRGNIKKINPNDILKVAILKPPGATNIYGSPGKNGVVIINTRHYQNMNASAQSSDTTHADFKPGNPLLIVDGAVCSYDSLKSINPANIFTIDTLKSLASKDTYINVGDYGAIIVQTKQSAIRQYQKKFSAFSEKYKSYLNTHQNNDDSCTYVLSGGIIYNDIHERVKKLYDIPGKKIKGIEIIENPWYNGGESKKYLVVISTKQ